MKKKNKIGLFALALGSLGFVTCFVDGQTNGGADLIERDTTFLVSLDGTSVSLGQEGVKKAQDKFIKNLRSQIGYDFRVTQRLEEINVLEIRTNKSFESVISSIPGVNDVAVNRVYRFGDTFVNEMTSEAERQEGYVPFVTGGTQSEIPVDPEVNHNHSGDSMHTLTNAKSKGAGSLIAILDTGYMLDHTAFKDFAPGTEAHEKANKKLNFDKLKSFDERLIAKRDPSKKEKELGSLYYNSKIPFYYDYGGSNLNASNGYDVYSQTSEHGNHVASIAAANGTYEGIAPNAQLALMKVFYQSIPLDNTSPGGTYAQDVDILEALNDCIVLGVDTLNMSLGTDLDDFTDKSASMTCVDKLTADGVNCNISAGNSGKALFSSMSLYKNWSTDMVDTGILGSYANSESANIIGSSTNEKQFYEHAIQIGGVDGPVVAYSDQVDYTDGSDGILEEKDQHLLEEIKGGDLVLLENDKGEHYGTESDYNKIVAETGQNDFFQGKIAVVDRGSNSFSDKAKAAERNGCRALIVINNDPTAYEFTFGMSWGEQGNFDVPHIPVVFVLYRDRQVILDTLKPYNGTTVKVGSMTTLKEKVAANPDKFEMSDFSSDGATFNLGIGPVISAPGSSIRGAVLGKADSQGMVLYDKRDVNKYGYLSGTSMAAPNYTGAVALLVGEKEFLTEEDRKDYLRSLTKRTQSTAQIYTHEVTTYGKINESKAYKDEKDGSKKEVTIYTPEASEMKTEQVPYSPRKQGAGIVNITKAATSKIYLEGLVPNAKGEYVVNSKTNAYDSNNFAKVELKNNELIKNGSINLGIRIHNEGGNSNITYTPKLRIMTPQITTYHNHDNELANYVNDDAKFEGALMQGASDIVIKEVTLDTKITLNGQKTQDVINLRHDLNAKDKEFLAQFDNGTFIEGYLILTPDVATSDTSEYPELNMPFMGFYKDYKEAQAVEPFNFEKEQEFDRVNGNKDPQGNPLGKLYGSDLVNFTASYGYGRRDADLSSDIVGLGFEDYQQNSYKPQILVNNTNLSNVAKRHPLTVKKENDGTYTLFVGGKHTDVLLINQFVYRSVHKATVSILDARNRAVAHKPILDIINNDAPLFKSHINGNFIGAGIMSHRGYAELPLFNANGGKLTDGEYKLQFKYDLAYGNTQIKEYKLVIDGTAPELVSKTVITKDGKKVLRLKFNELYISQDTKVSVNAMVYNAFTLTKVADGYLLDVPVSEETEKYHVQLIDSTYNFGTYLFNLSDLVEGVVIQSDRLSIASNYSYKVSSNSANGNIDDIYEITASNLIGTYKDLGEYTAYITYGKKLSGDIAVYGINENGEEVRINDVSIISDTTLKVTSPFTKFRVTDSGKETGNIYDKNNSTVVIAPTVGGQVFVDKLSGTSGEIATIYAIANEGYKVQSVKVNGIEVKALDASGNYVFRLYEGENNIEVLFVEEQK